jgi:hypothetical protein
MGTKDKLLNIPEARDMTVKELYQLRYYHNVAWIAVAIK